MSFLAWCVAKIWILRYAVLPVFFFLHVSPRCTATVVVVFSLDEEVGGIEELGWKYIRFSGLSLNLPASFMHVFQFFFLYVGGG